MIQEYDVIIIGGGSSGTTTAISLEKKGYEVLLIERGPELFHDGFSVSKGIPYRGSAGFHYSDIETGKKILESSIYLWQKYPNTYDNKVTYYLVMKYSVPDPEIVINNYKEYKKLYSKYINKYPELINRYGKYEDFFKILDKNSEEYNKLKNLFKKDYFKNIKYIVKTYEGLINGENVINKIKNEIIKNKNININYDEEVEKINENNNYYIVKTNKNIYKSKIIILCSWHVNEKLIKEIKYDKNSLPIITKRLKALCNIYINLDWCEKTGITSMFECMGAGFMISLPKGKENIVNINNKLYYKAKITYAPITNLFKYDCVEEPLWINDLLRYGKVSEINKKYVPDELKNKLDNIEQLIIDGISYNFKNLKENIIFESIKYGIVCTEGIINQDINSEFSNVNSCIHKRSYSGLYKLQKNNNKILIANYGMKFIYSIKNSNDILNILENKIAFYGNYKNRSSDHF